MSNTPRVHTRHRFHVELAGTLIFIVGLAQTGCLGPTYVIDRAEIARLERAPAGSRAKRLRVVQRLSSADTPPPAASWAAPLPRPVGPGGARQGVSPAWTQGWVSPGAPTYNPWWGGPGLRLRARPGRAVLAGRTAPRRGRGPGASTSGSSTTSGSSSSTGDLKAALAVAVVVGVGVGIGLAVTEGARYDGWVAVHPQHPVHLIGSGTRHRVVPLNQLRLSDIARDEEAVIVRHEGAGMWELGRAPLNREGFTYGFDLGVSRVPILNGRFASLSGGAIRVGLFNNPWLGVLGGVDMAFGTFDRLDAAVVTPHVQVVAAPIRLWRLHVGLFGECGWQSASIDAAVGALDPSGMRLGAGVIVQWEIMTRLALDFRWNNRWLSRSGTVATTSFTTGLSIY